MRRFNLILLPLVLLLAACGGTPTASSTADSGSATSTATAGTVGSTTADSTATMGSTSSAAAGAHAITMAMPYIPNVQFAHFYVAQQKGYYAQEGLKVNFDYNYETDVVQRIAQGSVQFGLASGDSVLLARAQGLPIITIATNSQKFPVVFFSKADQNITTPADLKGKTVGIPMRQGASYIGLLAMLYANKLQESDLKVQEVGFAQVQAVSQGKVQVGIGYGNNEPLLLEQQGIKVNVIRVADYLPLASDGLLTNETIVKDQGDVVRAFVRATLRGMQDVLANPDAAFNTSLEFIPELKKADAATQQFQRKVLQATLDYWQSDATKQHGIGYTDLASWQITAKFLRDSKLLKSDVDVTKAFTNDFLK
ncbi:MAG: ABC transporter substrate-binding protein [Herpetosiphonaceae bacterium]|nr:ABC transporter substrate-binding protein [Herpetosiphonaceae bacterium]